MAIWKRSEKQTTEQIQQPNRFLRSLKVIVFLLLFLCLIVGGFFLGVYLRVFDVDTINEKLELYKYPVIGQYFTMPENVDKEKNQEATKAQAEKETAQALDQKKILPDQKADKNTPGVIKKEEIEKQIKLRQAEEKKRVSKLARLYNEMKAEEAVKLLEQLDDDMVLSIMEKMEDDQVVQLLPLFEPSRGAKFTRMMYNGKPPAIVEVK